MIRHRLTAIALPLLLATGCASTAPVRRADLPAGQRFAGQMETADTNATAAIRRVADFEQVVVREEAAVAYATGGRRPADRPGPSAADAAGMVFAPAFAAIGDYGHVMGHVASGLPITAKPGPSGAELARLTEAGLAAVQTAAGVTVTPEVRSAGLAGIIALADLAETISKRGGPEPGLRTLAAEAEPHLAAVVELLKQVLGAETGQAVRGAVRSSRNALEASHNRLLTAARATNRDPVARYSLYRSIVALRDNDPVQGTIGAVVTVLNRLHTAHVALAADPTSSDTAGKVVAFENAVNALGEIAGVQPVEEQ